MDMKKFAGEHFVKINDVRDGPIQGQIAEVREGKKYDKPDLILASGDVLSLNATNTHTLIRAFGTNSDYWVGKMIEMFLGQAKFNGTYNDSVLVRAISPSPKDANADKAPDQDKSPPLSDEIPF
jgi:hypothetical protein